ncbi:MAG: T9SS type A sorting domain-containing protein, partial [Saprospiraceae bacterium]|nr:T9SS type A sorting domain-containing protein [Saprospiraceae bacterium]
KQETTMFWDDDLFDWQLDSKKHYYYNGLVAVDPMPSHTLHLQTFPNPATAEVRFALVGDGEVLIFNSSGKTVLSQHMSAGNSVLNIANLPAGLYLLTARQGKDLYVGKVAKQ